MAKNSFTVVHILYGVFAGICLGFSISNIIADRRERAEIAEVQRRADEAIGRYEENNQRARAIIDSMGAELASSGATIADTITLLRSLQEQMFVLRDMYSDNDLYRDWNDLYNNEVEQ